MMDTCAYVGCDSGRHRGDRLFSIPKAENIRKKWISRIGNPALNCYTSSTLSRLGICVKHFSREMFKHDPVVYKNRRKILKRNAVPIPPKPVPRNKRKRVVIKKKKVKVTREEDNNIEKDMSGNETEVVINGQNVMITEEEDNDVEKDTSRNKAEVVIKRQIVTTTREEDNNIEKDMSGNETEVVINGQNVMITEEEDNDVEKDTSGNEAEVKINGQRVMITEEEDNGIEKDMSRNETVVVINGQKVTITEEEDNNIEKDMSGNETEVVINGQRVMITEEENNDIEKDMSGNETEVAIKRRRVMITENEDKSLSSHLMSIKKEVLEEDWEENDPEMEQEEKWYYHYQESSEKEVEQEARSQVTKPMLTHRRLSLSVDDEDDSMEWIKIEPQISSQLQIENSVTKSIFEMRLESENDYLRKENRNLKRQLKFFKDKLRQVKAARDRFYKKSRKVETVDEFLNRHKCINNVARTLVKLQLKGENAVYTSEERDLAIMMYYNSPSAYSKLRKSGCYLPAESTIRR